MTDAITTAAYGMQSAMRAFSAHAEKIASADIAAPTPAKSGSITQPTTIVQNLLPNIDLPSEIVGSIQAAASFRANLAVFQAGSRLQQKLLDVLT